MTFTDPEGLARHRKRILGRGAQNLPDDGEQELVFHGVPRLIAELNKYLLNP